MHQDLAINGVTWKEIAESAYKAYAVSTGNKNYQGNQMPEFSALPRPIQIAWEVAVRQSHAVICAYHAFDLTLEERERYTNVQVWNGWIPPM